MEAEDNTPEEEEEEVGFWVLWRREKYLSLFYHTTHCIAKKIKYRNDEILLL